MWKAWCLCKASAMGNATGPDCNKISDTKTDACVNSTEMLDDNGLGGAESKVDILVKEKWTDANSEINYAIHLSKNGTLTAPDKTNKILILISS